MSPSAKAASVSPQAWAKFAHCASSSSRTLFSSEAALTREPFEASQFDLPEARKAASYGLREISKGKKDGRAYSRKI